MKVQLIFDLLGCQQLLFQTYGALHTTHRLCSVAHLLLLNARLGLAFLHSTFRDNRQGLSRFRDLFVASLSFKHVSGEGAGPRVFS